MMPASKTNNENIEIEGRIKSHRMKNKKTNTNKYGKNKPKNPVNHQSLGCILGARQHATNSRAAIILNSINNLTENNLINFIIGRIQNKNI